MMMHAYSGENVLPKMSLSEQAESESEMKRLGAVDVCRNARALAIEVDKYLRKVETKEVLIRKV